MVEWRAKLSPESVKAMDDAALAEKVEKKRKRAAERVERNAIKAITIGRKSRERFEGMRKKVTTNPSTLFQSTEGKPAAGTVDNTAPYYHAMEYVSVSADTSPGKNRPWGHGYVVAARGAGTGTVVDVAYQKIYDDGATRLPKYHPLQALICGLGRVHRNIAFADVWFSCRWWQPTCGD